jgi:hypothetical protein
MVQGRHRAPLRPCPQDKLQVIYNGVDLDILPPAPARGAGAGKLRAKTGVNRRDAGDAFRRFRL